HRPGGALLHVGGPGAAPADGDRPSAGRDPGACGQDGRAHAAHPAYRDPGEAGRSRKGGLAGADARGDSVGRNRASARIAPERWKGAAAAPPEERPRHREEEDMDADAIVVGGGLAGLVAACELVAARKRVILLDQEPEQALGGQAFWSFGGLMFVDSPE